MNCVHQHIFPMHQTGIAPKDLPASLFEEAPSHAIGHNMLKFWLRPLSKLGLDEGTTTHTFSLHFNGTSATLKFDSR